MVEGGGIGNSITGAIVSIFTSVFTVQLLYTISAQRELWIAIFAVAGVVVVGTEKAIGKCFYKRNEQSDVDRLKVTQVAGVLRLTITFVMIRLVMDLILFLVAITTMKWYHYINIMMILLFFAIVIISNLEI